MSNGDRPLMLSGHLSRTWQEEPYVARITRNPDLPTALRDGSVLVFDPARQIAPEGFRACLALGQSQPAGETSVVGLPHDLEYLADGDIVLLTPGRGEIHVLYRVGSDSNTIFLTERCNSRCIMCPQVPRESDDGFWRLVWLDAIPLMSRSTRLLGISGGEPTLAPDALLEAILACRSFLPETALHLLSNGRMFSYLSLCEAMAQVRHQDLVVGIPLYSQVPCLHDYIVQAEGAFDETIRGIMNLARFGQAVEIRMVIMKQTAKNLPEWARFVARNLPFASHVALMGMEAIGHGRAHFDDLWVDPASYRTELAVAVEILAGFGINVSIYNHQLCVLDQELWPFARKSISDWKTGYVDECAACSMKEACGGFFSSSSLGRSKHIHRI